MASRALNPVEHHVPTIAVKFYGSDYLIVGHGSTVKVYNYKTSEVLASKQVFKKNKVHGIAFHRDTFVFYGARSMNILSFDQILEDENLSDNEKMINDWIIAGEFSANGLEIFILTAHNIILSIDAYSQTLQWEKSLYGEKSILYSGSIKVTSKFEVFINAGTVMGGVIIWDLYKEEVLQSLSDHEGSIFNVQTSQEDKYVISCSDDRSIKLWDFKTGELLSTAWGHTARIWNLRFYNNDEAAVSVSEDLTLRTWTITENRELVPNQTYELHSGRHVWGLDVNQENTFAATSGNDGRVRVIDINPKKVEEESVNFSLEMIAQSSGAEYQITKKEIIKGLWKLKAGLVLVTSEGGIFILKNSKWELLLKNSNFGNFVLVNGYFEQNVATFTNSKGDTLLLKFNRDGEVIKQNTINSEVSKVINALSTTEDEKLYLMVESPNSNDSIIVYQLDAGLEIVSTTLIEKRPTFVITAFEIHSDILFIGYRLSSLGVYRLSTSEELQFIKKLSISDTITSINKVNQKGNDLLLTITNRDGYYVYFKFNSESNELVFIHTNNTRKGFLEGSFEINNELIVYGFKSSYFYIYNESKQYEIAYENCGGAHRLWKLFRNGDGFEFFYIRDGILSIRSIPVPKVPDLLTEGTHGREIRDISIRETRDSKDRTLYVTGAEDTTLKISSADLATGDIRNHWTIRKHTSGLQKVKFLSDELIASSSAREEFFIWKICEEFQYPLISLIGSLNPSSDNPDLRISDNPDLRIMDFDHQFIYKAEEAAGVLLSLVYSDSSIKLFYFDLETKEFSPVVSGYYKTCCLWDVKLFLQDDQVLLLTGATDGFLTLWNISEEIPFKLVDSKLQFVEGFNHSKLSSPQSNISVHQNGIKSFEVISEKEKFLVATGSDDNGLAVSAFKLSSDNTYVPEILTHEPSAASSTITSVSYLDGYRLLVGSVDQIVRLWSFKTGDLELIDSHYTTVADTGSSDVVKHDGKDYGLIGGCGLSIWELK
jgi:WD40 repeat protein